MRLKEVVGINLKYYRYKSGLSQEEFYSKLGLNYKYMASLERGEINVSLDYIEELAKKLKIKPDLLVIYDKNKIITKKRIDEKEKVGS